MKTIILDDDPTGTQSASDVTVLFEHSADLLTEALHDEDSVYVQTNTRAEPEVVAVSIVRAVKEAGEEAARRLQTDVRFVLRGDSTLRGHVFAESEVFGSDESIIVFVPAFPAGGRTTVDGGHLVDIDGVRVPVERTEFANDPVFGFASGRLVDYVAEKSDRKGVHVPLSEVRDGKLSGSLQTAPAGAVVTPDAVTEHDIQLIAEAIEAAQRGGRDIVVRCAAPLAAALAGVASSSMLALPLIDHPTSTLLVCGSHTAAATRQLAEVSERWGEPNFIDTDSALLASEREGARVGALAAHLLAHGGMAVVSTERSRSQAHNTLDHGRRVMEALTSAVRHALDDDDDGVVDVVISKGGITSSEIARVSLGARSARVMGQILPGISAWSVRTDAGRSVLYIVVPGNVGGPKTLVDVLAAVGRPATATKLAS